MNKILVTGANGYVGSHVVKVLSALVPKNSIVAVDFNNNYLDKEINYKKIDILDNANKDDLFERLGNPTTCIHLAWKDGFNHNAQSHLDHLSHHYEFLKNMIDHGCNNITVMGTMHEIGYHEGMIDENTPCNPLSHYGIAKNALRQLMMSYVDDKNINLKWLRAFYITGDDERNKSIFSKIIELEKNKQTSFPFTDGKNKYDFIDINILAKQIVAAALQTEVNGIINVCSGEAISLKDKVEDFLAENNFKIRPEYGVFQPRKYDSPCIWGDHSKIQQVINKHPI